MLAQERYNALVLGVNATSSLQAMGIGGFLALTSGTITIVNSKGTTIVNAHPVTAGGYYPLPFVIGGAGQGSVTLAGGASGTLAVN